MDLSVKPWLAGPLQKASKPWCKQMFCNSNAWATASQPGKQAPAALCSTTVSAAYSTHVLFQSGSWAVSNSEFGWLNRKEGTSLVVQWLRVRASNAEGDGFSPWLGNEDPTCCTCGQNINRKKKKLNQKSIQRKSGRHPQLPTLHQMVPQNNVFLGNHGCHHNMMLLAPRTRSYGKHLCYPDCFRCRARHSASD